MWVLKNSKELLKHLKSPTFNHITSIKSIDFFTLYTTIPHQRLKDRLTSIIRNAFFFRNGNQRYKYLVLGHEETYFVKEHSDSKNKYSEDDTIKMLEFLVIDNIFVVFTRKNLPADSRHSNGYELCPSSRQHLSVFIRSGFHTVFALNGKETFSISVQSYLQVQGWCFVHKQTQNSNIIWARCILWNLRSKTPQRAQFLLLAMIYCCRFQGIVNFTLPSTTNEMILISTSQTFRSWVVIFHLPQPMAFFLNLYDTPGLASRVNVLSEG